MTTLVNNSAGVGGGGIYLDSGATLNVSHSIVAGSAGGDCSDANGTIATNLNNFIGDLSCNPLLAGNPMLGPLADNGGPTQTHELIIGSPAIDRADDGACPGKDQRGHRRPVDGDFDGTARCDIGAFEFDEIVFADGFETAPTE